MVAYQDFTPLKVNTLNYHDGISNNNLLYFTSTRLYVSIQYR